MSDEPAGACGIDGCGEPAVGHAELALPISGPDRDLAIHLSRRTLPMCERHGSAFDQRRPLEAVGDHRPNGTVVWRVRMPGV